MKLELRSIYKSFSEKEVLKDINFSAESGAAVGLLGRNGAGKTTTIRIIMDVFPPDSGEVWLDGKRISRSDVKIGYLPEERGMYPKKLIGEQMVYFGELRGMSRSYAVKAVKEWLERVELSAYYNKKLDTLSKGNQQKIQLATALIDDPDIVILDEPFSGLDPVNAQLLKNIIKDVTKRNKLVLFSSHQMSYVEEFCDYVVMLDKGRIVLNGSLKEIKRSYPRERLKIVTDGDFSSEELGKFVKSVDKQDDMLLVELNDSKDKDAVLKLFVDKGIGISRFEVIEPSLEEIFVRTAEKA